MQPLVGEDPAAWLATAACCGLHEKPYKARHSFCEKEIIADPEDQDRSSSIIRPAGTYSDTSWITEQETKDVQKSLNFMPTFVLKTSY